MRDGKTIIFTGHAKKRAFERLRVSDWKPLIDSFATALKFADSYKAAKYFDDQDVIYVVAEEKDKYIILTLYRDKTIIPTGLGTSLDLRLKADTMS